MNDIIPSTIQEQIEMVDDMEISYRTLHEGLKITRDGSKTIRIPFSSIVSKYSNFLSNIIISKKLTNEEYNKYLFKPKTFSEDIYGTTEFWDIILLLNNCKSVIDFDKKEIKYYDPDELKIYLNEIMIIEEDNDMIDN